MPVLKKTKPLFRTIMIFFYKQKNMTITVLHFDDYHTYYNVFILFSISNQFNF